LCQPRTETTVRPGWPRADFGAGLVGRHDRQRQHHSGRLHLEIYNPQGSVGGENQSNNTAITNDSAGNGNNRETGHRIDRPAGETSSPPARPATVTPHPKRHLIPPTPPTTMCPLAISSRRQKSPSNLAAKASSVTSNRSPAPRTATPILLAFLEILSPTASAAHCVDEPGSASAAVATLRPMSASRIAPDALSTWPANVRRICGSTNEGLPSAIRRRAHTASGGER